METPDLFPAELAAAQRESADETPFEPLTMDRLGLTEDDKQEQDDSGAYWLTWEESYAQQVCQKRWNP